MKLSKTTILTVLSLVILGFSTLKSDEGVSVNVGADVMNRYIFRGTDYGNSPSIQPTFSISTGGFEIGYWGAISLTSYYQEIDLYAKYTIGGLSIIFTDYYIPYITSDPASSDIRYFVFEDKKTAGAVCYAAVEFKNKMNWDDALDVWGVHGVGGVLGTILLGVFASKAFNAAGADGLIFGNPNFFLAELGAVAIASIYAFVFTYLMLIIINFITPVKVSEEMERQGLDMSLHGEQAYDEGAL